MSELKTRITITIITMCGITSTQCLFCAENSTDTIVDCINHCDTAHYQNINVRVFTFLLHDDCLAKAMYNETEMEARAETLMDRALKARGYGAKRVINRNEDGAIWWPESTVVSSKAQTVGSILMARNLQQYHYDQSH